MGQGVARYLGPDAVHIQGEECPIFIYDFSPGHIHHHVGRGGGVDQVLHDIVAGEQVGSGEVHQNQVSDFARGNHSGVPAQGAGSVDGGHGQNLRRGQLSVVLPKAVILNQSCHLHLLKDVVAVVGGNPVGAQGHTHAAVPQEEQGSHSGHQLQVGHRVVDGGNAPFRKELRVPAGEIDAVGGDAAVGPHAVLIQHLSGGFTVFFNTFFVL